MPKKLPPSSALALPTPSRGQKQTNSGWRDQPIRISIEVTAFPSGRLNEDAVSRYQLDNSVLPYSNTIPLQLVKALEIARKKQLRVLLTYALDPQQPYYGQYVPSKPIQGYVCKTAVYLSKTPRAAIDNPNCDNLHEDHLLKVECADPADGDVLWEASANEQAAAAQTAERLAEEQRRSAIGEWVGELILVILGGVVIVVVVVVIAWGLYRLARWVL